MKETKVQLWTRLLKEQEAWIGKCGGDLAGYIENYHGTHNRTVENATAIYQADLGELQRIKGKLAEAEGRKPSLPVDRQVGAVLVFKPGIDKREAERMLDTCYALLALQSYEVQIFNPEHGSPVFYVP